MPEPTTPVHWIDTAGNQHHDCRNQEHQRAQGALPELEQGAIRVRLDHRDRRAVGVTQQPVDIEILLVRGPQNAIAGCARRGPHLDDRCG